MCDVPVLSPLFAASLSDVFRSVSVREVSSNLLRQISFACLWQNFRFSTCLFAKPSEALFRLPEKIIWNVRVVLLQ